MSLSSKKQAAALKYALDRENSAPIVVASGVGETAQRIIDIAVQNEVPVYEDDSLATLLSQMQAGQQIPPEMFQAIVDIYIYFLNFTTQDKKEVIRGTTSRTGQPKPRPMPRTGQPPQQSQPMTGQPSQQPVQRASDTQSPLVQRRTQPQSQQRTGQPPQSQPVQRADDTQSQSVRRRGQAQSQPRTGVVKSANTAQMNNNHSSQNEDDDTNASSKFF